MILVFSRTGRENAKKACLADVFHTTTSRFATGGQETKEKKMSQIELLIVALALEMRYYQPPKQPINVADADGTWRLR